MLKLVKRAGSPYWIARGTVEGRRVERSTGCTREREAKREVDRILAELEPAGGRKRDPYFADAVTAYLRSGGSSRFIDPLLEHFAGSRLSEIDNDAMRGAALSLYADRAPDTIRRQLYTPVKSVLNLAADEGKCAPPRLRAPKGGSRRTIFLTPEEADDLITSATQSTGPYLPALITFLIGQGCRLGETLQIDGKADISLDHRYAILRDTKNGDERRLTLVPRVVAALSRLPSLGQVGPLFRRHDGRFFKPRENRGGQIRTAFGDAVKRAGLSEEITPHICRHTWATWFHAQTKDVVRLREEGGWKSGEWERYTKIGTPELGRDALKRGWDYTPLGENWGKEEQKPGNAGGSAT